MHRLIVALLAAVDAAVAAAVGVAVVLAPFTLVWVLAFGGGADWSALWTSSATVWQLGHVVPLWVTLPGDYLAAAGIDPAAASFTLSLAPLAFATFTAVFAARSGVRASQAEAWVTGVLTGTAVFAAVAALVALTARNDLASATLWQGVLYPALLFGVPALVGALVTEWRDAGEGAIARLRDRVEAMPHGWGEAPGLIARGGAVVVVGLVGVGAVVTAIAVFARGGEVVALYEAANVDALGATAITLAQLGYLPTLIVWAVSFIAGPGFSLGEGTSVAPAGTQVGVLPGVPVLGVIPESTTPWLLLLALLPVALGAFAGWIARSRLVAGVAAPAAAMPVMTDATADLARTSALAGLIAAAEADRIVEPPAEPRAELEQEPVAARLVVTLGIAVLAAAAMGILCLLASGSLGPGTLSHVGPAPGAVALAVGLEVVVGAGILLLSPRRVPSSRASRSGAEGTAGSGAEGTTGSGPEESTVAGADESMRAAGDAASGAPAASRGAGEGAPVD